MGNGMVVVCKKTDMISKKINDVLQRISNSKGSDKEEAEKEFNALLQMCQKAIDIDNGAGEEERADYYGLNRLCSDLYNEKGILVEDDTIILKRISEAEYSDYERLFRETTIDIKRFDKQSMMRLWKEYTEEGSLFCSIMRKEDNTFVGYCGVKNMKKKVWEIAIELLSQYRNCGYGYRSLTLFLDTLRQKAGVTIYRGRVDGDNYASQKLMEKLGGVPDGIAVSILPDEKIQKEMEEEYQNLIDERLIEAAGKFGVEPKKLLSHVLKYKIIR